MVEAAEWIEQQTINKQKTTVKNVEKEIARFVNN